MWWPHSILAHSMACTAPLTSTVKSSFFTHAHPSTLSLAATLPRCHTNHSCYINNGWTFSGQTLYFNDLSLLLSYVNSVASKWCIIHLSAHPPHYIYCSRWWKAACEVATTPLSPAFNIIACSSFFSCEGFSLAS